MTESPKIIELQQKFEDNPPRYFASLANEYRKAGDFQRAISICRIYLDKLPGHIAGHVVMGQALHASGKMDDAAELFKTVLRLDPENLIALKCMGDIAQANGDLVTAHHNFRQVLTADPRDHDTNGRLKTVELAMKAAAEETAQEWIPPRVSGEFVAPEDSPAAPEAAELDNLPTLEPPAIHEAVPDDDLMDTLMPDSESGHDSAIAEPVSLESAEESLAVTDLMEQAGEAAAPDDGLQYRTAEFSLPAYGAADSESAGRSADMESEAEALMDEAEIPPLPVDAVIHDFDSPMRTGEYSLSTDTAEWNRQSDELTASSPEDELPNEPGGVEPAGPFITETVAELYLQQGFTGEALLVYRQLGRTKPNDQRIAARIVALEERLADEHTVRQAALDTTSLPEPEATPPAVDAPDDHDDWFAAPDVAPARARQTVQEFFAVLGRARPEVRRKPERIRVTADEIRAAADITAGFGAFGTEPQHSAPGPIPESPSGDPNPQDDVRRFRAWLDGLSDS